MVATVSGSAEDGTVLQCGRDLAGVVLDVPAVPQDRGGEALAQTLRTLGSDGLISRTALPVVPPHLEYALTPTGQEVGALLHPLMAWIAANADDILGEAD